MLNELPEFLRTDNERLAELLHIWYLEATSKLHPESFNKKAQKQYSELTEEQKFIDRFIADKVAKSERLDAAIAMIDKAIYECLYLDDEDPLCILNRLRDGLTMAIDGDKA